MKKLLMLLLISAFCACSKEEDASKSGLNPHYQCITHTQQHSLSRLQLLEKFDKHTLMRLASAQAPNNLGAMARNKQAYFHVRFQLGIAAVADFAIASQHPQALEHTVKAMEYAFEHQLPEGDFELVIPPDMADETPSEADVASGVAFFLSSLGTALNTLEQSTWYHAQENAAAKNRVELLRPKVEKAAAWLSSQQALLASFDQKAPNRLLYDALAFYSLGKWLQDEALQATGLEFADLALMQKSPKGYFLENGGWDSSYQGVATQVGFALFSLLEESEAPKKGLWNALSCATDWQHSRILSTGEISTEGNTRVYPGGETFLGQEKSVDWRQTMISLMLMSYYSDQQKYYETAIRVMDFYS